MYINIITEYKHSIYSRLDKGANCSTQGLWFESQVDVNFFLKIFFRFKYCPFVSISG